VRTPRRLPPLLLAAIVIGGMTMLAAPSQVRAANGMTETGTTTYEVIPGQADIQVTIKLSIYNGKADTVDASGQVTYYWWNATDIYEEVEGGPISVSSDAGSVAQSVVDTSQYYRDVELDYPNVYYGQTRTITATYTIPAAPRASGGFRAGSAYASLCAAGNGADVGTVSIVIPDGFTLNVDAGDDIAPAGDSNGKQVYSSSSQTEPYKF